MKALSGINPFGNHPVSLMQCYHQGLPTASPGFFILNDTNLLLPWVSKPKKEHYKYNPLKVSPSQLPFPHQQGYFLQPWLQVPRVATIFKQIMSNQAVLSELTGSNYINMTEQKNNSIQQRKVKPRNKQPSGVRTIRCSNHKCKITKSQKRAESNKDSETEWTLKIHVIKEEKLCLLTQSNKSSQHFHLGSQSSYKNIVIPMQELWPYHPSINLSKVPVDYSINTRHYFEKRT